MRQRLFGVDADEVWDACSAMAELCNMLAMTVLGQSEHKGDRHGPPPVFPAARQPRPTATQAVALRPSQTS